LKKEPWVVTSQDEKRVHEGVGFDEGAIQVNAKRLDAGRC